MSRARWFELEWPARRARFVVVGQDGAEAPDEGQVAEVMRAAEALGALRPETAW